jgi:conjugative relaxase-like TrwC/TraI family protein
MSGAGQVVHYFAHGPEAYYLKAQETLGHWQGSGAARLRLDGAVDPKILRHLLDGFTPDRRRALVQNAGSPHRQCCWDQTFSAPKSVSVLWASGSSEVRRGIEASHDQAVTVALHRGERLCGHTRRGPGGRIEEPVSLVYAVFPHFTSRALQPQLHSHAVLINLGLRRDGTSGTIQSRLFFQHKLLLGSIYQTELAHGLQQRLGLRIEPARVGFHIVGVPKELCRAFSARRQQIEQWLQARAETGSVASKQAALATRAAKQAVPLAELEWQWRRLAQDYGWGPEQAQRLIRRQDAVLSQPQTFQQDLQAAVNHLPPEARHPRRIVRLARETAMRHGADATAMMEGLASVSTTMGQPWLRVEWRRLLDPTPWQPPHGKLLRQIWHQPFPNAWWGPARRMRLPGLAVELPRLKLGQGFHFQPRWRHILWKRRLMGGELRVQERRLFPHAPQWSPLHHLRLPAVRWTPRTSKWHPRPTAEQSLKPTHSH